MDRQILTGPGPLTLTLTSTGATAKNGNWAKYGPCRANQITLGVAFASATTSAKVTLQGILSTASTAQAYTIAARTYAQRATLILSTVNLAVAYVRLRSSGSTVASSIVQTGYIIATP